jgi:integrase
MQTQRNRRVSGHVYRKQQKKGPTYYWKVRLPDGGEERKAIGPEWTGNGRPLDGYFTKRTAQAALEARLTDLRRGVGIPTRTGATFDDAAELWYTLGKAEKGWKPSTQRDYRSVLDRHLKPRFGPMPLGSITTRTIVQWRREATIPPRTMNKLVAVMHGIFERARREWNLPANPAADVEPVRVRYTPEDYDFYTVEEVLALVRETEHPTTEDADASEQDAAIFVTAAFTGLRLGELLALRVRDIDFTADSIRVMRSVDPIEGVGVPKSGKGRTVPMVEQVAQTLARLLQRDHFTGPDDLLFPNEMGRHLDGSALRRRYKDAQSRAKLRPLRFHDLRHTFGSLAITRASTVDVQAWLGHADARTTARYTHYKARSDEARVLGDAFRVEEPEPAAAPAMK